MATTELAARFVFIMGITNIVGLLLVLFSCRCIMNLKPEKLSNSKFYVKFYRYHCYYWWFFIISVLLHFIFALVAYGIPFGGKNG